MTKVLVALEAYWENRNSPNTEIKEALIYNVWKQCNKWLKLKEEKHRPDKDVTELSRRRKLNVERLRADALEQLALVSDRAAYALGIIEDRKKLGMMVPGNQLQPLDRAGGYALERDNYLEQRKQTGSTFSMTYQLGNIRYQPTKRDKESLRKEAVAKKLRAKGLENLTPSDINKLRTVMNDTRDVVFMNKMARLKQLVCVEEGLITDLDGKELSFEKMNGFFVMCPYVMDKYGNLFIFSDLPVNYTYVTYDEKTRGYGVDTLRQINHSSILAGAECLCAGTITVGYDCMEKRDKPGVLAAISNASGHYKPTADQLRNCLRALQAQDVSVRWVRVGNYNAGDMQFYWGEDFLKGDVRRWVDDRTTGLFTSQAPPIRPA